MVCPRIAPDVWGRRVLSYRNEGRSLGELDFLLQAGRDRIGALVVTPEPTGYPVAPSDHQSSLEDLLSVASIIEAGQELPESLGNALLHGSSVGGARPKSLLYNGEERYIAKFPSTTDYYR